MFIFDPAGFSDEAVPDFEREVGERSPNFLGNLYESIIVDRSNFIKMKISVQYVNDSDGKTQFVQIPFTDWEKVLEKLQKYEQTFKIKSDLEEAFEQVAELKKSNSKKATLEDFLDEL